MARRGWEAGGGPQELNEYDRGRQEEGPMAGRGREAGGGPHCMAFVIAFNVFVDVFLYVLWCVHSYIMSK